MKFFYKEKIDEYKRIYHFLGFKFVKIKKKTPAWKLTNSKIDDAVITLKTLRNLSIRINTITTMVLGSSHARMGFIENEHSINFGIDSQDLYYSYEILKKYINIIPNLKNIVLYYAIFCAGHDLGNSPQSDRCVYYKKYFDIPYKNNYLALKDRLPELSKSLDKFYNHIIKKVSLIPLDIMNSNIKPKNSEILENKWIKTWQKLNALNTQNHYLEMILKLAKENNKEVLVICSAYNPRIKNKLKSSNELFSSVFDICSKYSNADVLNAFDDESFTEDDFLDIEHMSISGARKMTNKIYERLKK